MQGIKEMKKEESLKIPSIPFIPVKFWGFWNLMMYNILLTNTQNPVFCVARTTLPIDLKKPSEETGF
jgi:hypothetical protein